MTIEGIEIESSAFSEVELDAFLFFSFPILAGCWRPSFLQTFFHFKLFPFFIKSNYTFL